MAAVRAALDDPRRILLGEHLLDLASPLRRDGIGRVAWKMLRIGTPGGSRDLHEDVAYVGLWPAAFASFDLPQPAAAVIARAAVRPYLP